MDSAGAADAHEKGGDVWFGVLGGCDAAVVVVVPWPLVCYWTSPCP